MRGKGATWTRQRSSTSRSWGTGRSVPRSAILLGQLGRRVVVLERYRTPYPLPRAVHYDHEVARILQVVRCGRAVLDDRASPPRSTSSRTPSGSTLIRFGRLGQRVVGLAAVVDVLAARPRGGPVRARSRSFPRSRCGAAAWSPRSSTRATRVVLSTDSESVRARYVVGCDGANSTVRSLIGDRDGWTAPSSTTGSSSTSCSTNPGCSIRSTCRSAIRPDRPRSSRAARAGAGGSSWPCPASPWMS